MKTQTNINNIELSHLENGCYEWHNPDEYLDFYFEKSGKRSYQVLVFDSKANSDETAFFDEFKAKNLQNAILEAQNYVRVE